MAPTRHGRRRAGSSVLLAASVGLVVAWLAAQRGVACAAETITDAVNRSADHSSDSDPSPDPWAFATPKQVPADDASETGKPDGGMPDADTLHASGEAAADDLPDPATVDWSILNSTADLRATSPRRTGAANAASATWSRSDKPDGFSVVTVKQSLLPWGDARIGADLNVAGQSPLAVPLPEKLATSNRLEESSGTGWAAATAPGLGPVWDKTTVEARLDPGQDQTKVGTAISKSVPLVDNKATVLILQGGYTVTDQASLPLISNATPQHSYSVDESARLQFTGTGTSLIAEQALSPVEDRWLKSIGAEQALFGGVNLAGKVSETPSGLLDKSLTAGFRKTW